MDDYTVEYRPNSGMCTNCTKLKEDCSHLDFEKMEVISEDYYFIKTVINVRCREFEAKRKKQR
jgi:hypothetical protein